MQQNSIRTDIGTTLTHLTSKVSLAVAMTTLTSILDQRLLLGSNKDIRGSFTCVCLTETPTFHLGNGLISPDGSIQYQPLGLVFNRDYAYKELDARIAFYGTEQDYGLLDPRHQWRFVKHDLMKKMDHTWEREWRAPREYIAVGPSNTSILLPTWSWVEKATQTLPYSERDIVQSSICQLWDQRRWWNVLTAG